MIRGALLTVLLGAAVASASGAPGADAASRAEALFEKGDYAGGVELLRSTLADEAVAGGERARALMAMVRFYERDVGNYEMALSLCREIRGLVPDPAHPLLKEAVSRQRAVLEQQAAFARQDGLLDDLRGIVRFTDSSGSASLADKRREQVVALERLIASSPGYYRLAEAYCLLGKIQIYLGRYAEATRALKRAKELKPAIDMLVPVSELLREAEPKYYRLVSGAAARIVLWCSLVLTAVVFYGCRPWRWIRPAHLAGWAAVMALWALVFFCAAFMIGRGFEAGHYVADRLRTAFPSLVRALPGNPGCEILRTLFIYGCTGILGVLALSTGARLILNRGARTAFSGLAALILLSALVVDFRERADVASAVLIPAEDNPGVFPGGAYYFRHPHPQPYILTDPRRFRGIELEVMDDKYWQGTDPSRELFAEWVKVHCRAPEQGGSQAGND